MRLITICNYPNEEQYNLLGAWWLEQALKHSDLNIEIWYQISLNNPLILNNKNHRVKLVEKNHYNLKGILNIADLNDKAIHNIGFKMFNLCMEREPYIYLDMDAILFSDINPLLQAANDKPAIMIDHQPIPGHTKDLKKPYHYNFLNSGVQIISDPSIMDFALITRYQNKRRGFIVPGTDQAMIFNYFVNIMYNYAHPLIGTEWNNCAGAGTGQDEIKINHYWMEFKPWNIMCPRWLQFLSGRNKTKSTITHS